jgi:hypothetical protein
VVGEGAQHAQAADVNHVGDLTDGVKKVALD